MGFQQLWRSHRWLWPVVYDWSFFHLSLQCRGSHCEIQRWLWLTPGWNGWPPCWWWSGRCLAPGSEWGALQWCAHACSQRSAGRCYCLGRTASCLGGSLWGLLATLAAPGKTNWEEGREKKTRKKDDYNNKTVLFNHLWWPCHQGTLWICLLLLCYYGLLHLAEEVSTSILFSEIQNQCGTKLDFESDFAPSETYLQKSIKDGTLLYLCTHANKSIHYMSRHISQKILQVWALLFQGCSQHWQSGKQLEVVNVLTL